VQTVQNRNYKSSAVAEMGDRARARWAEKWGGCCAPFRGGPEAGSPSNTMWPGPRPTPIPSGILIYPTVWPGHQRYDRTNRTTVQLSLGRTVLQTVAQKLAKTVVDGIETLIGCSTCTSCRKTTEPKNAHSGHWDRFWSFVL